MASNIMFFPLSDNSSQSAECQLPRPSIEPVTSKTENYEHFTDGFTKYNDELTDKLLEYSSNKVNNIEKPGCCTRTSSNLSKQGLRHIDVLRYHNYITHLNLSANYITDLKTLDHLPFLQYLDASHNLLTNLLGFETSINLRYANFSYNLIQSIPDLSRFWSLECLDVSHNLLTKIRGLQHLSFLEHLDLSYNYINKIEGLNGLNLTSVILDYNEISHFAVTSLLKCEAFSVASNNIDSLKVFSSMPHLKKLNVCNNLVKNLIEITFLSTTLTWLNLRSNPITQSPMYEDTALYTIKSLQFLDDVQIDAYRKSEANFKFSSNAEQIARNCNAAMYMMSYTANTEIDDMVLPCYQQHAPIIMIIGPNGTRSKELIKIYMVGYRNQQKPNIVFGVSHTTRPKTLAENEGEDYYFVTNAEFNKLLEKGQFLTYTQKYGHQFGIARFELQKARHSQPLIFATDLNAGLQMREQFPNVKLIFALPKHESTYRMWLNQYFRVKPWISTYIMAYVIISKAIPLESRKSMVDKKRMCYSILQEIIDYIQLVHEKKSPPDKMSEEESQVEHDILKENTAWNAFLDEKLSSILQSSMHSFHDISLLQSEEVKDETVANEKPTIKFIQPWTSKAEIEQIPGSRKDLWRDTTVSDNTLILESCFSEENAEACEFDEELRNDSISSSILCPDDATPYDISEECLKAFIEENVELRNEYNRIHSETFSYQVHTDDRQSAVKTLDTIIRKCEEHGARKSKECESRLNGLKYQKLFMARYHHIIDTSY